MGGVGLLLLWDSHSLLSMQENAKIVVSCLFSKVRLLARNSATLCFEKENSLEYRRAWARVSMAACGPLGLWARISVASCGPLGLWAGVSVASCGPLGLWAWTWCCPPLWCESLELGAGDSSGLLREGAPPLLCSRSQAQWCRAGSASLCHGGVTERGLMSCTHHPGPVPGWTPILHLGMGMSHGRALVRVEAQARGEVAQSTCVIHLSGPFSAWGQ